MIAAVAVALLVLAGGLYFTKASGRAAAAPPAVIVA
jgi:hypothetical protein